MQLDRMAEEYCRDHGGIPELAHINGGVPNTASGWGAVGAGMVEEYLDAVVRSARAAAPARAMLSSTLRTMSSAPSSAARLSRRAVTSGKLWPV